MSKVLILGDSGCGKTTLMRRVKEGVFIKEFIPSETVGIYNLDVLHLEIPGSYKFTDYNKYNFRHIEKVIIMVDKSSKISLENAFTHWLDFSKEKCPDAKVLILINKDDLETSQAFEDLIYRLNVQNIPVKKISVKNEDINNVSGLF